MNSEESLSLRSLKLEDSEQLSELLMVYGEELSGRKIHQKPQTEWAQSTLQNKTVLAIGAFEKSRLVGFALSFDLPEAVFQTNAGQLDDLFVLRHYRNRGLGRKLIASTVNQGKQKNWSHLRWLVPPEDMAAIKLYEKIASERPWRSFLIRINPERSF